MTPVLVVLAAGMSARYGRLKQLEPVGPGGEALLDYGLYDALRAGFARIVFVVRAELEPAFRAHMAQWWDGVPVGYAHQEIVPGRAKPWGTAEAILAAKALVDGPFAVSNADDFYGASAYVALCRHLEAAGGEHALVGYRLGDTLSPHGGVSRGLCETDAEGRLQALTELRDVRAEGASIRGTWPDGRRRLVPADGAGSMNLWGFVPEIHDQLRAGFLAFQRARDTDPEAEYLISTAVHELVAAGRLRLRVLRTDEQWMGMTHPNDREAVAARLRALVAGGRYPEPLRPPSTDWERT